MSKHVQKYPGLYAGAKAIGMNYVTALVRVKSGMTVAQALAKPLSGRGKHRHPVIHRDGTLAALAEREAAYLARWKTLPGPLTVLPPWQKPDYVVAPKPKQRPRRAPRVHWGAEDTSPLYIRKIRAAYCDEFIKTGNLNPELAAKLKDYANECSTNSKIARRISAEQEAQRDREQGSDVRDDSHGIDVRVDGATARTLHRFLRSTRRDPARADQDGLLAGPAAEDGGMA